jgi:peptidoglycan-N-acetylglucosamine deacetylase
MGMGVRSLFALLAALALLLGTTPQVVTAAPAVGAASAGSKTVGYRTYAWGTVTESGAQDVWTEAWVGTRWSRSQSGRTNSSGGYTLELTYGFNVVGTYRFRVGSATSSGTVYSPEFTLNRTAWQPSYAGTKPVGQTTYTWATMPAAASRSVWTEALVGGSWSRSQTRTANSSGYFSIPLTYGMNQPGQYTFRVGASTARGVVYSRAFVLQRTSVDLVGKWRGLDLESFPTTSRVVALTFDGGASNTAVTRILSTLRANGVPATFFVTGQFARAFPNDVRAMATNGHPVGNHSNTHPAFSQITDVQIRSELSLADASISSLTGKSSKPLFRFPFGDRTAYDIQVVNNAGYIPIRWSIDTLGWQGTSGGITASVVRQRVLNGLRPGAIVLMHVGANPDDGTTADADALQGIINDLRARGYTFATVSQLLATVPR